MLSFISLSTILFYTVYFGVKIYQNKHYIKTSTGKCISMVYGMISATTIGIIIAIPLQGQLALSTILAIIVSLILVCFIAAPFGLTGMLEAIMASFMGGMMGAMLGEMLSEGYFTLIIVSFSIFYLLVVFLIMALINREIREATRIAPNSRPSAYFYLNFLPILLIATALFIGNNSLGDNQENNSKNEMGHEHHQMGEGQ
ncbi:hypothetical protein [Niallia nealsonii]|uniref:Uncharacterized protein n=1 Tax=Niallia nealsonii TaxID=115979 RepID=A0A2N0Z5E7_9BACI|nr:hypothetical protein [Niallia nealsonii]PKG24730.1 hypothetical protein CWS01_05635 [Niallia nealsonii]